MSENPSEPYHSLARKLSDDTPPQVPSEDETMADLEREHDIRGANEDRANDTQAADTAETTETPGTTGG
jgi:hypothetical protein